MNDLKISKKLALAIGWRKNDLYVTAVGQLCIQPEKFRRFDYRDPAVIWPIAKQLNAFPYMLTLVEGGHVGKWNCFKLGQRDNIADTPEKAVALAVIRSRK